MLNPIWLQTLQAVIAGGSFADAARELGYTPSAVSQQMAALERAARVQLFERGPRSMRVTASARWLAERSTEVLGMLAGLDGELDDLAAGTAGRLRIGSFPTAGARLVPDLLARLAAERPRVEVTLDEGEPAELVPRVMDGSLDIALVYRYDLVPRAWPEELAVTPLVEEPLLLLVAASHPIARRRAVRLPDLAGETWIASREGSDGSACLDRLCARADFAPRVAFRSNDYDVVRGLVRAGLGIALVPALAHSVEPGILTVPLRGRVPARHVEAVTRAADRGPLVTALLAAERPPAGRARPARSPPARSACSTA